MGSRGIVERLSRAAGTALIDEPVVCAYLFGSHARGEAGADSDIDVAILLGDDVPDEAAFDLRLRLARSIERAAGVGPIEVVVLNGAPLPLLGRVLRDRILLFSDDEARRVRFESLAERRFLDFDIHARRLDDELLRSIADGRR